MELQGLDVRLAIMKTRDFLQTLGDAQLSLTYADKKEHEIDDERILNIISRTHSRHALIDYNGCFDLLLQIPWFLFRLWKGTGVRRNKDNWVIKAEKKCNYDDVKNKLAVLQDANIKQFLEKLIFFNDTYRFNNSRNVTIRDIANDLKHKRNIRLREFRVPSNLNLNINGIELNSKKLLEERGIAFSFEQEIFESSNPDKVIAKAISTHFGDEQTIDIKYINGELFRGEDLVRSGKNYSLEEIYMGLLDYHNNIVEIFNSLQIVLNEYVELNPQYKNIKHTTTSYNVDNYFKATQSNQQENKRARKFINYGKHKVIKTFNSGKKLH